MVKFFISAVISVCAVPLLFAAPQLRLSTSAVPVTITTGTNGAAQTVEAFNIGDGALNLTATASNSWLAPTIGAARPCTTRTGTCIPINIALNTAALASGTYTDTVTVNDPNAIDAPQIIVVTAMIGGVPSTVDLYAAPNAGTTTSSNIANTVLNARGPIPSRTASTSDGRAWLSVGGAGSFIFFYSYPVTATAQPGQPAGNYTGSIALAGSPVASDNKTVTVNFHITSQPVAQLGQNTLALRAVQGGAKVTQNISVQNVGQGSLALSGATVTTTSGGTFLSASVVNNGSVAVTADPGTLAPGVYQGTVSLASNAANNTALTIPVQFIVAANGLPVLAFNGVVSNGDFGGGSLAPGHIAAAFGDQFSTNPPAPAAQTPLPTTLGGVRVLVNGTAAPLYYVQNNSGGPQSAQINFQIPYETPTGQALVTVERNGQTGNTVSVNIVPRSPRIPVFAGNYGVIVNNGDGSLPVPTTLTGINGHPARPGDVLVMYCVGLGQTTPPATTGAASTSSPLEQIDKTTASVSIDNGPFSGRSIIQPDFVGLTPNFVGLYQVNLTLPPDVPIGPAVNVQLNVQGAASNIVQIATQK